MGLFSKIFKSSTRTVFETPHGPFMLVYSNKTKNLWSNNSTGILKTVRGTASEPDSQQIDFLKNIDNEIGQLDDKINQNFIDQFNEAEETVDFKDWQERFKLTAIDIEVIDQGLPHWSITFEDQREPYAHFNLYIEGQETRGFSIDT